MRLPIFGLIEETTAILQKREAFYAGCALELEQFFAKLLVGEEFSGTNARVKTAISLREKILRKRLYQQWSTAQEILSGLSDLIGLRVHCRFLSEEMKLFERLTDVFGETDEAGLYYISGHPEVKLNLAEEQPQQQKNGLTIYRIDGYYYVDGLCVPFELQIKSLVHVFWADIEHQLVYKDNRNRYTDEFFKEFLFSAYATLQQVDRQLQMLFESRKNQDQTRTQLGEKGLQALVSSVLSDVFLKKMDRSLGFTLNFAYASDILARYILAHCNSGTMDEVFFQVYERIDRAKETPLDFESTLELKNFSVKDVFCKKLGAYLMDQINTDYDWNLFFRMLFTLEVGDNLKDFTDFLKLVRQQYARRSLYKALEDEWERTQIIEFQEQILSVLADLFIQYGDVHMLAERNIENVQHAIQMICEETVHTIPENVDWQAVEAVLRNAVFEVSGADHMLQNPK